MILLFTSHVIFVVLSFLASGEGSTRWKSFLGLNDAPAGRKKSVIAPEGRKFPGGQLQDGGRYNMSYIEFFSMT
jgi:hypothetical protein